jgi:hypothetical protein
MDPEILRQIEEIKAEIRELILVMTNLGRVMSAIGDEELKHFREEVDETSKSLKRAQPLLDQYGREIKSNTESLEDNTEAQEKARAEADKARKEGIKKLREEFVYRRQQRSSFRDLSQEMSSTRGVFGRLEEGALALTRGNMLAEGAVLTLSSVMQGATAGITSYAKSLYAGQLGATSAASALSQFTDVVGKALQGLGAAAALLAFVPGLGKLLGLGAVALRGMRLLGVGAGAAGVALQGAGAAAKIVAEQNERLYRTYQDLAQAGVSAADGMLGLARDAQELGYGLDEAGLQAFSALMKNAASDLALMSGSVREGRRRFVEFNNIVRSDVGEALQNLGLAPEAINEGVAAFVANQARLGRVANMTNQQLTQGAVRYIAQLDILAKLTGQDAKSIQARMDADLREERFRAGLLQVERTQGAEAAETLRRNIAALGQRFPEVAAGLKDMTGGFIDTDAARKVFQMGITRLPTEMSQTLGGGFQAIARAAKQTSTQFGESLGAVSAYGPTFGNLTEQIELGQISVRDFDQLLQQAIKDQKGQAAGADGVVAANTQLRRGQMAIRDSLQDLVKTGVAPATNALEAFTGMLNRGVQGLERGLGITPPPGARMGGVGKDMGPGASDSGVSVAPESQLAGLPGIESVTTASGAQVFRGGIMGGIERLITQGRGFRAYQQGNVTSNEQSPPDPSAVLQFRGDLTGNRSNFDRLDPDFRERVARMAQEYLQHTRGEKMPFVSGHRTREENMAVGGAPNSRHLLGLAADLGRDTVATLERLGLLEKYGFKKGQSGSHISDTGMKDGGIVEAVPGGTSVIIGEGGQNEAVVPLPSGDKIPVQGASTAGQLGRVHRDLMQKLQGVADISTQGASTAGQLGRAHSDLMQKLQDVTSVNLGDWQQTGPTVGGFNAWKGFNAGPLTTDLAAIKDIAERLGAFDRAANIITDPKTWQTILQSGIATNFDLGGMKAGSGMLPELRGLMAEEIEILTAQGATVEQAVGQVREEFGKFMAEFLRQQQQGGNLAPLLQELISLQRNQNSTSEKMLQVAQN